MQVFTLRRTSLVRRCGNDRIDSLALSVDIYERRVVLNYVIMYTLLLMLVNLFLFGIVRIYIRSIQVMGLLVIIINRRGVV